MSSRSCRSSRSAGRHERSEEIGRTPTTYEYDETRRELIGADERRTRGESLLSDLLPTSGQILQLAGGLGWNGACELAARVAEAGASRDSG
ncbi:MAG TPA: hypothetical protein VFA19_04385 [Gaiellaceae bacterium]|nr:hypothetical protein [Gaiellaceae bacterium]